VKALLLIEDRYLHAGGDFTFSFSVFGAVSQVFYYGVVDTQTKAWGPMGYFDSGVWGLSADGAGNIYAVGVSSRYRISSHPMLQSGTDRFGARLARPTA
jgi:hypothetical protein